MYKTVLKKFSWKQMIVCCRNKDELEFFFEPLYEMSINYVIGDM